MTTWDASASKKMFHDFSWPLLPLYGECDYRTLPHGLKAPVIWHITLVWTPRCLKICLKVLTPGVLAPASHRVIVTATFSMLRLIYCLRQSEGRLVMGCPALACCTILLHLMCFIHHSALHCCMCNPVLTATEDDGARTQWYCWEFLSIGVWLPYRLNSHSL